MNSKKGAMAVGRRVTVSSRRNLGVWIGVVKIDGAARWCTTFVATRTRARELAKPVAEEARDALRANRPICLPPTPFIDASFMGSGTIRRTQAQPTTNTSNLCS